MENVTVTQHKEVVQRILRHTPVTDNYVAVQIETIRTALSKDDVLGKVLETKTFETICHKDRIPALKKDGVTPKTLGSGCDVVLMTDAVLRCYREYGFDVHYEKHLCGFTDDDLGALDNPFTALSKGLKVTPVKCDYSSHMLFHPEKDEIYPVGMHLNYIEARLDNEKYDLPKALKILEGRSDVRIFKESGSKGIDPIPYYNASDERNECIEAFYMPTHEMANQLWKVCKQLDKRFASCRFEEAIDVVDALGLIEGGAMREKYVLRAKKRLEE